MSLSCVYGGECTGCGDCMALGIENTRECVVCRKRMAIQEGKQYGRIFVCNYDEEEYIKQLSPDLFDRYVMEHQKEYDKEWLCGDRETPTDRIDFCLDQDDFRKYVREQLEW